MNPADGDFADIGDKTMLLTCRNLLKAGNCPENPAYRLTRYKPLILCRFLTLRNRL